MKTIIYGALALGALSSAWTIAADRDRSDPNPADPSLYPDTYQLVFFAVLEGLYEDGVAGEALELMVPDERGMANGDDPEQTNFVYTCPICSPTFEALRLYKVRSPFAGQKLTRYSTFGPGLSDEMLTRLKGVPNERRDAIQELIEKWVKRRLDSMALSDAERESIEIALKEMKEKGEKSLKGFQEGANGPFYADIYEGWKKCAACEGASAASMLKR